MLITRFLSAVVILPLYLVFLILGGWPYAWAISLMMSIAGLEYAMLMRQGNYRPYTRTLIGAILAIVGFQAAGLMPLVLAPGLAFFLVLAMVEMLAAYGRGDKIPAVNFGLTVAGALYIGWLGAHFIAIRQLPDGFHWAMTAVMATGFGDVGAYMVGRFLGHHKMAPVVSPGKTWEGYLGGGISAALVGALVAGLSHAAAPTLRAEYGAIIGLMVGLTSPVGDLGMSVLKRMIGAKNFSNIIPGHGGMLDRLDSMLVAIPMSYYVIGFIIAVIRHAV